MNIVLWNAAFVLLAVPQTEKAKADEIARVTDLVKQVQRADYEGNRPALAKLHDDLAPFVESPTLRSRVQYWRGFALWRRSINGFNEGAAPAELERDLMQAIEDFRAASTADPSFSDAKVGEGSSLVNLSFLKMNSDSGRAREWFLQSAAVLDAARKANPDNPRLLWVQGANQWYARPGQGGGQAAAFATYERGLEIARADKSRKAGPIDPQWGEPELLMNLAFAHLNAATPNPVLAEKYAREALALVPYWHYVKDILLPQILKQPRSG
jgi:hypothetical protein